MKILLTGFEPFGSLKVNPSELVVQAIAEHAPVANYKIVAEVLPTEFRRAGAKIRRLIRTIHPDIVIATGVAATRDTICLERIALNFDDDPHPDNSGRTVTNRPIVPGAPLAYESTLPLSKLRLSITKRKIPVRISYHAGTYVCNHVFYVARHETEMMKRKSVCGFVHLPKLQEKSKTAQAKKVDGMPLEKMIKAIQCCIETTAKMKF